VYRHNLSHSHCAGAGDRLSKPAERPITPKRKENAKHKYFLLGAMKICRKTVEKRFKSSTGCSFIKSSVIVVGGRETEARGKEGEGFVFEIS